MGSRAWPEREGEAEAGAGGGGEGRRAQPGWGPAAAAVAAAEEGSGGRSRFIQSEPRSQRAGAGSAARAPAPARPARDKGLLFQASARGRPRRSCSRINQLRRELAPNKAPRGRGGGRGERRLADGGGKAEAGARSQPSAGNGPSQAGKGRGCEPQVGNPAKLALLLRGASRFLAHLGLGDPGGGKERTAPKRSPGSGGCCSGLARNRCRFQASRSGAQTGSCLGARAAPTATVQAGGQRRLLWRLDGKTSG
ncbi:translation initiation factor IF-2-like isoform X2 [Antechinus flavipes]|uniref:translation initiation factor IF-2-like isoform X2 n=1 Tax=Antechinus flavipes TaxID=38775 RepID=UPI0022363B85|nr:translation initiation factor IF-2-like isoform X2 [Antechinus flavipes]